EQPLEQRHPVVRGDDDGELDLPPAPRGPERCSIPFGHCAVIPQGSFALSASRRVLTHSSGDASLPISATFHATYNAAAASIARPRPPVAESCQPRAAYRPSEVTQSAPAPSVATASSPDSEIRKPVPRSAAAPSARYDSGGMSRSIARSSSTPLFFAH